MLLPSVFPVFYKRNKQNSWKFDIFQNTINFMLNT